MNTIIAPSILSANFLNLESDIKVFQDVKDLWLHLDIMDSHFVPNLTFGKPVIKDLQKITKHPLDAHFMVTNPDFFIENFKDIGIHNFTFHWEATKESGYLVDKLKKNYPSVGISLKPATPIYVIPDDILKKIDLVLLMSVNPGFSGQKFMPNVFEKIEILNKKKKELKLKLEIQIDGGVDNTNAQKLIETGATNLVSGSYIFSGKRETYTQKVESLR